MGALKLHTLKQKLWAIVATSFIARVIVFFALPNSPSSFGPDEYTYSSLTKWIGEARPAGEFPAYGEGLYLSSRSIIIPASILYRIGFGELDAIRLISTLYGLGALIIVVTLILKLDKENSGGLLDRRFNGNLIFGLVILFAFLPSHFIWSNLGLRESATEFWVLATFAIFFMLYHFKKRFTTRGIVALVASIAFAFSSRPQVGWVIGVSLIAFLVFNLNQVNSYFMIAFVICGVLLGSIWNQGSTTSGGSTTSVEIFSPLTNVGELVSSKQQANQLGAESVIETQSCPKDTTTLTTNPSTRFDSYFCIAWRSPYMVSTFLFRPILGLDVTSTTSMVAAIENIFWLALFVAIIVLGLKRRAISFIAPILPALVFFALYVLGASAYQGNMGTGFRHKSLILWVALLMFFALTWKRTEIPDQNFGNKPTESAV